MPLFESSSASSRRFSAASISNSALDLAPNESADSTFSLRLILTGYKASPGSDWLAATDAPPPRTAAKAIAIAINGICLIFVMTKCGLSISPVLPL